MIDANDETLLLSRRAVFAGAAGTALAASLAPALAAATPAHPALDAHQTAAIVRRMRYRTDAGTYFWWFRGRNHAQQGARLTPLCGMVFGSMIRLTPRADGGFDTRQYELGFRTDLVTGELIERLRNPFTGEMVEIPFAPVGPTAFRYSADNVPEVPAMLGGSKFTYTHNPEQVTRADDTVFVQYHAQSLVETPGKPDRVINDLGMMHAPAALALNPKVMSVPAWIEGTDVTDYPRWLNMPAGMGTQTLRSIGRKVHHIEDMPADWKAIVAKFDPELLKNPEAVFERKQATYKG